MSNETSTPSDSNKGKGVMFWVLGAGIAMIAVVLLVVVWGVMSYLSANNYAASTEAAIEARWKDNQNIYSNYGQKIMEAAQVPAMYKEDLMAVMKTTLSSRYGEQGSKATMQFLQEAQVPFDSKLYTQLQEIIEAGRTDFQNGQTARLDVCRQYSAEQGKIPRGFFIKMAGYPKLDSKLCNVVTDDRTNKAFETMKQEPIKLR